MSRKSNKLRNWILKLNYLFWAMALSVWGIIVWRSFEKPDETAFEAPTDLVHVTGSREKPPATVPENGTRSDTRLFPDEALLVFIIDDFGPAWKQEIVNGFINFPADITLSIIPGNRTSKAVAKAATDAGKEVFIHLPMEPSERIATDERDMIWVKTEERELRTVVGRAIQDIPEAVGVNNHMGSRATSNSRLMKLLATELDRRKLIFVDSRTSERSQALRAMQEAGVNALGRDIFLDVEGDSATVAARIADTARIARKRGWAIAIGHVKGGTLAALRAALPKFEREGFKLVSAGELTRKLLGK